MDPPPQASSSTPFPESLEFLPDSPMQEANTSSHNTMVNQNTQSDADHSSASKDATGNGDNPDKKPKDHGAPGSAWNNSKAIDEFNHAFAGLADKSWNMEKLGELLRDEDDEDVEKK